MIKNAIRLEMTYSQVTDKTEKDRLTSLKPAEAHAQFIIIIANVITQAQVSKGGSNKNSLLCKCSYTAFFTLFYFHFVRGSKATFTCNYHPLHSTVLLLSHKVLLQGNSIRKPKFSRIPRIRVISKDSNYYT